MPYVAVLPCRQNQILSSFMKGNPTAGTPCETPLCSCKQAALIGVGKAGQAAHYNACRVLVARRCIVSSLLGAVCTVRSLFFVAALYPAEMYRPYDGNRRTDEPWQRRETTTDTDFI